jgi:hypothetical protein
MFDTKSSMQDPFAPSSALKTNPIVQFPQDYFFVLRVVQLLRGMALGMDVGDFSTAAQWKPYAARAVKQGVRGGRVCEEYK